MSDKAGIALFCEPIESCGLRHSWSFRDRVMVRVSASAKAKTMAEIQHTCQCPCGTNQFSVSGEPIVRFFCHCSICQDKYNAPFADVALFKLSSVALPEQAVTYGQYKRFVAIDRGICDDCHKPCHGQNGRRGKRLCIYCSTEFRQPGGPAGQQHACVLRHPCHDVDDLLPKHHNWLSSQWAFLKLLRSAG